MAHTFSTIHRRGLPALAAAAVLAGTLLSGAGTATAAGSADSFLGQSRNDASLQRTATHTVDNVTITREIVGANVG